MVYRRVEYEIKLAFHLFGMHTMFHDNLFLFDSAPAILYTPLNKKGILIISLKKTPRYTGYDFIHQNEIEIEI
jgi:hypothetical protein